MDFVRSKFGTNEPLPVEHFFPHFYWITSMFYKKKELCITDAAIKVLQLVLHIGASENLCNFWKQLFKIPLVYQTYFEDQ